MRRHVPLCKSKNLCLLAATKCMRVPVCVMMCCLHMQPRTRATAQQSIMHVFLGNARRYQQLWLILAHGKPTIFGTHRMVNLQSSRAHKASVILPRLIKCKLDHHHLIQAKSIHQEFRWP